MYKCIVVDDEPLAQTVLEKHIGQTANFYLIGLCSNALEAFEVVSRTEVDLMFLDIRMPSLNGLDFIKALKNPPPVIFTTAYSEYAIDSYELEAVDYLLKPITYDRFQKSIHKFLKLTPEIEITKDYTYFKVDGRLVKLDHDTIIYVKSIKDYLVIHTIQGSYITHMTMKCLADLLPAISFRRIHRSFLIGIKFITVLGNNEVCLGDTIIPIGDNYKSDARSLQYKL